MVAPPSAEDWSGHDWKTWQWKQQWDDGHDKVGALETKLEALEKKIEKQERDHQEFIEKQERVFIHVIEKLEKQQRDHQESMKMADEFCHSSDERLTHLEQINLQGLRRQYEDLLEMHGEMIERVQSLEDLSELEDPQAVFGPLPDYGASRADAGAAPAPPQHAPPTVNLGSRNDLSSPWFVLSFPFSLRLLCDLGCPYHRRSSSLSCFGLKLTSSCVQVPCLPLSPLPLGHAMFHVRLRRFLAGEQLRFLCTLCLLHSAT